MTNEVLPPIQLDIEQFWTINESDLHFRPGIRILKTYKLGPNIEFDILLQFWDKSGVNNI